MDIRDTEPFSIVQCPHCGTQQTVPKKLGDFLLLRFIGKGGMGAVFQGYDTRLGRQVAIKVLGKVLGDDPAAMDNFLREARAAAQINSPYVVQIFQVGEERNKPFIVMELINGGQLDKLIEKQPLSELRALEVCHDAALGLQSAQEIGLFHGDIKPENILFDQHQTAKIADFGLAQFLQRGQKSKPGEIWGTPYYIAPEKARKQQEDYRSDIYSLGATLFHALTGQPPFEGDSAADVVLARLKNYAPSIRDINPSLHDATAKLVARMLEPDPSMRYPNYTSLLSDLDLVIETIKSDPVAQPSQKKKKKPFFLIVLLLLLVSAGVSAYFFAQKESDVFTEEQQQQLMDQITGWSRNIYRFDLAALRSVDDALARFSTSLPPDSTSGKDWVLVIRGTVQLLALSTNELTNTLAVLLEKTFPPAGEGKPDRAVMPCRLASYLTATNGIFSPGPEKWPTWYRDFAEYVMAAKMLAQGDYDSAQRHLADYIETRPYESETAWPYAFQPIAVTLHDGIKKWNARQDLLDKYIIRGNFDKALEKLESYETGNPPIFMAYVERNKPRLGRQESLAKPAEPVPDEEAIRKAEEESRKQREQAAREALQRQEDEERAQREQEKEAARKESERVHQLAVDADIVTLRQSAATAATFISRRDYEKAKSENASVISMMKTDEGRLDAKYMTVIYANLDALDQMIITQIGSVPLPPAVVKMLGGEPKRADRNGVLITLTHGETLKSWEQIGNPLYIKLAESILAASSLPARTKAERYMALSFFCKAIQAPKTWVTRYAAQAVECEPSIRTEMEHGQRLLGSEP